MRFQASIIFQLTEMCANASSLFCLSFYRTALFIHFHLCVCVFFSREVRRKGCIRPQFRTNEGKKFHRKVVHEFNIRGTVARA